MTPELRIHIARLRFIGCADAVATASALYDRVGLYLDAASIALDMAVAAASDARKAAR